jgi:hypothetical protein
MKIKVQRLYIVGLAEVELEDLAEGVFQGMKVARKE